MRRRALTEMRFHVLGNMGKMVVQRDQGTRLRRTVVEA